MAMTAVTSHAEPAQRKQLASRFLASNGGAAAVEFSLVLAPMLAVVLAIAQIGLVMFAQEQLETATELAVRQIRTGQAQSSNLTQSGFQTLVCKNLTGMFDCSQLLINVQTLATLAGANTAPPNLTYNADGTISYKGNFQPGGAYADVLVQVMYPWPTLLSPLMSQGLSIGNMANGDHLLMSTAVFQNEPQA